MNPEKQFLTDSLVEQLTLFVIQDYQLTITDALELVYNSQLYEKIMDEKTGLYYQSASYNYELLRKEIAFGKIA